RRIVLHVLGGDRLALPLRSRRLDDLVSPGGRGRPRGRRDARRPYDRREREGARRLLREASRAARGGACPPVAAVGARGARRDLPGRARADVPRGRSFSAMTRVPWASLSLLALPALALARLAPHDGWGLYVRLAAATACLLIPGFL